MKILIKKLKRQLYFLKKPRTYLVPALGLALVSAFVYMLGTEITTTPEGLSEIVGTPETNFLTNPSLDTSNHQMEYIVRSKKSSWFYQIKLVIPEKEVPSTLAKLKSQGFQITYQQSLNEIVRYRPQKFLWGLIGILFAVGILNLILGSFHDSPNLHSSRINNYQPSTSSSTQRPVYHRSTTSEEEEEPSLSFNDVAGIDEVKEQIEEIVRLFKDNSKIAKMGGKIPRGVLLNGPPGTGKTLLAKVTAHECGANFIATSGSDFVEMYVGVGASRVRNLFHQARAQAPCIIFIDEIDAVATRRGFDNNSEREQTINQLLVEMDGFNSSDNILVIAATNQIEKLDPAILRPGRFDRQIMVHLPDINGREKILNIYLDKTSVDKTVQVRELAKSTAGFSGADLANLVNEAILYAARNHKEEISQKDLFWAKDKILMGSERKIAVSEQDRKQTATHEIGHALIARILNVGTVSGVSIIPRGRALGVTQMDQEDVLTLSKQQALHQIAMMMGGRVAENLFFNHLSTGATNDLQRAHQLARSVIVTWGMSDLGPLASDDQLYKSLSDDTKKHLDLEIIKLVTQGEHLARELLTKHQPLVQSLAQKLFEQENLSAAEFAKLTRQI